jgi:NADH:ubiquinone oxidoreductase subunit K
MQLRLAFFIPALFAFVSAQYTLTNYDECVFIFLRINVIYSADGVCALGLVIRLSRSLQRINMDRYRCYKPCTLKFYHREPDH